jgi:hypothetical protein
MGCVPQAVAFRPELPPLAERAAPPAERGCRTVRHSHHADHASRSEAPRTLNALRRESRDS